LQTLIANNRHLVSSVDAYFSADVETDGPIPGPFSMLSFAIVYAGSFDGRRFERPLSYDRAIYKETQSDFMNSCDHSRLRQHRE
jgi:hypothetical protein